MHNPHLFPTEPYFGISPKTQLQAYLLKHTQFHKSILELKRKSDDLHR